MQCRSRVLALSVVAALHGCGVSPRPAATTALARGERLPTALCYLGPLFGGSPLWLRLERGTYVDEPTWFVGHIFDSTSVPYSLSAVVWRREIDSIHVRTMSLMASGHWQLAVRDSTLVGRGWMSHDVGTVDSTGRMVPGRSDWPGIVLRHRQCPRFRS